MSASEPPATTPPSTGICSECGRERSLDLDGLVQYHDWPRFTRRVCSGAKKPPALGNGSPSAGGAA